MHLVCTLSITVNFFVWRSRCLQRKASLKKCHPVRSAPLAAQVQVQEKFCVVKTEHTTKKPVERATQQKTSKSKVLGALNVKICLPTVVENMATYPLSGPVLCDAARLSQRYPPIARYGVFGVSTWPIGCDTPSPPSECFPIGEHAKWRCDTPPTKRASQRYLRDTL